MFAPSSCDAVGTLVGRDIFRLTTLVAAAVGAASIPEGASSVSIVSKTNSKETTE
jgi:hypothetical protein